MSGVAYITLYIIYVAKCDDRLWLYYNVSICCTFRCAHPPTMGQPAEDKGATVEQEQSCCEAKSSRGVLKMGSRIAEREGVDNVQPAVL